MPNFWTITGQKIQESIHGPRTKDVEFDKRIEEMLKIEKGIVNVRMAFANFLAQTSGLKKFFNAFYTSITEAYDSKSDYYSLATDISDTHQQMEKIYDEIHGKMKDLNSQSQHWTLEFEKVKAENEKREEARKIYDHYDEKLEKMYKERDERTRSNKTESGKDFEQLNRNEVKFQKAAEEFATLSQNTYEMASSCLENRFDMMNPIITKFMELESKLFYNLAKSMKNLDGITEKFKRIQARTVKREDFYDPCKYLRGSIVKEISKTLSTAKKKEKEKERGNGNERETKKDKERSKDNSLFDEPNITRQYEEEDKRQHQSQPIKQPSANNNINPNPKNNTTYIKRNENSTLDRQPQPEPRLQKRNTTMNPGNSKQNNFNNFDFEFDNDMNLDISQMSGTNTSVYNNGVNNQHHNSRQQNFQDESHYRKSNSNIGNASNMNNLSNMSNVVYANNMRNSGGGSNMTHMNNMGNMSSMNMNNMGNMNGRGNNYNNTSNQGNNNFDLGALGNILDFASGGNNNFGHGNGDGNSGNNARNFQANQSNQGNQYNNSYNNDFANTIKTGIMQGAMQGVKNNIPNIISNVMNSGNSGSGGGGNQNNNYDFSVKKGSSNAFDPFKGMY